MKACHKAILGQTECDACRAPERMDGIAVVPWWEHQDTVVSAVGRCNAVAPLEELSVSVVAASTAPRCGGHTCGTSYAYIETFNSSSGTSFCSVLPLRLTLALLLLPPPSSSLQIKAGQDPWSPVEGPTATGSPCPGLCLQTPQCVRNRFTHAAVRPLTSFSALLGGQQLWGLRTEGIVAQISNGLSD